jgi:hypothetical protein
MAEGERTNHQFGARGGVGGGSLTVDATVGTVRAASHLGGAVAHGVLDLKCVHVKTL